MLNLDFIVVIAIFINFIVINLSIVIIVIIIFIMNNYLTQAILRYPDIRLKEDVG